MRLNGRSFHLSSATVLEVLAVFALIRNASEGHDQSFAREARQLLTDLNSYPFGETVLSRLTQWLQRELPLEYSYMNLILKCSSLEDADPELIYFCIEQVSAWDLSSNSGRQDAAKVFENYIEFSMSRASELGQFTTPQPLIDFMIALADLGEGDVFYDPFCGMGGFLASAAMNVSARSELSFQQNKFFGRDMNSSVVLISLARIVLSGVQNAHIFIGDSTQSISGQNVTADCIVTNPPFGTRRDNPWEGGLGIVSSHIDDLAVQHVAASLSNNGRAFIIVPQRFLFSTDPARQVRQVLLEDFCVEAIMAIPPGLFKPYTSIRTNLLIISKKQPSEGVLFCADEFMSRLLSEGQTSIRFQILKAVLEIRRMGAQASSEIDAVNRAIERLSSESRTDHSHITSEQDSEGVAELSDVFALLNTVEHNDFGVKKWLEEFDYNSVRKRNLGFPLWELTRDEIRQRDYDLLVRRPSDLVPFLDELISVIPSSQLTRLSETADVFIGSTARKELLGEVSKEARGIMFVRGEDVSIAAKKNSAYPELSKTRAILLPEAASSVKPNHFLRSGDILLSAIGKRANFAIVGESIESAVASNSVIVIRPHEWSDRHYLLRLLQSSPYQDWFATNSSSLGNVMRFTVQSIRELPIVVLPLELRERLANYLSGGESADTIARLAYDLQEQNAPVHLYNEKLLRELIAKRDWSAEDSERWWSTLNTWTNEMHHLPEFELADPTVGWLLQMATELSELKSMGDPRDRYALFQAWRNRMAHSPSRRMPQWNLHPEQLTFFTSVFKHYADRLAAAFLQACSIEANKLVERASIIAKLSPETLLLGAQPEMKVVVENKGALPLKKPRFSTSPIASNIELKWLKPEDPMSWEVKVDTAEPGKFLLHVFWTAERIDGTVVDGRIELAYEIVEATETKSEGVLFSENPYVCGAPIGTTSMFYGRSDLLQKIRRSLRTQGPSTVIVLEGNRRAGKTSLCKQLLLPQPDLLPGWIRAYWSLQAAPGHSSLPGLRTREIYYNIVRELCLALYASNIRIDLVGIEESLDSSLSKIQARKLLDKLRPLFTDENGFDLLDEQLELISGAVGDKRLLLILDEFEKLQEGIDNGITSPQLPENLRDVFQRYDKISGILTGSKRIKRLREEYWSVLYGIGIRMSVGGLDELAARQLIEKSSAGVLIYSSEAVDRIIQLCACQPFLIQSLCYRIFEECAQHKTQSVTVTIVDSAVEELLVDNEHFAALWQFISNDKRRYLAYIVANASPADVVTSSFLAQRLEEDGISSNTLDEDLSELRELDVLGMHDYDQGNNYYIGIPLLALWVRKHKDFAICREKAMNEE